MAGKNLKDLADQVWDNHGVMVVTTFDASIVPGSVIERRNWNDITHVGHLKDGIVEGIPKVTGPAQCMLADFRRTHELSVAAALELMQPSPSARAHFAQVSEATASFESPVIYGLSLLAIEDLVEAQQPEFWGRALGQWLKDKKTRVVHRVIRGRLTFRFQGSGGAGIDLKSGVLGDLKNVGLAAGWRWRNEATLESKKELVIAVEAARYDAGKARFTTDR